jgi:putative acetyltransferase
MKIQTISPDDEQAKRLIARSNAFMTSLYPLESNHLDGIEVLKQPNVLFVGAYWGTKLVGCGAVKILTDDGTYGEIKRLFVSHEFRGQGVSLEIMHHLENYLITCGVKLARLETGVKQPEALGLYRKLGYVERSPFGSYGQDPLSVFMEKALGA